MVFIGPWYWRLFKDKRRRRQREKACLNIWRFVLETVQGLAQSFHLGLANSIHPVWSSFDGVTDPPQLDKGGVSIQGLHWSFIIRVGITFQVLVECILVADITAIVIVLFTLVRHNKGANIISDSLHYDVLWKCNVSKVFDKMSMRLHSSCESYKSM